MWKPVEWFMGIFLSAEKIKDTVRQGWGGYYISWFKEELELIASLLSSPTDLILIKFNQDDKLVRFLNQQDEIIATVKCHGEMGCATDMTIITNLSADKKAIFVENLKDLKSLENPERPRRIKIYFQEFAS